jgi:histidine triad (HIT) family protein
MSQTCTFCQIIQRQLPAYIIKEDELVIVFLSTNNHPLVVPKKHIPDIYQLDDLTAAHIMQTTVQIARAVKTGLACEEVYLTQANEATAGQDVFHFHLHMYPCWSHLNFAQQQATEDVADEERQESLQKIQMGLKQN